MMTRFMLLLLSMHVLQLATPGGGNATQAVCKPSTELFQTEKMYFREDPCLPLVIKLNKGFLPETKALIEATTRKQYSWFAVELRSSTSGDIALQIHGRPSEKKLVRNSKRKEEPWGKEEVEEGVSFLTSDKIKVAIVCLRAAINITINSHTLGEFSHRLAPSIIDEIHISGGLWTRLVAYTTPIDTRTNLLTLRNEEESDTSGDKVRHLPRLLEYPSEKLEDVATLKAENRLLREHVANCTAIVQQTNANYAAIIQQTNAQHTAMIQEITANYTAQITNLTIEMEGKNRIAQKILPYLSIRHKIEVIEAMYGPELRSKLSTVKFAGVQDVVNYHSKMFAAILEKKGDGRIQRIENFIKEENITNAAFCLTVGGFFVLSSDRIHVPPLTSYTEEQLIEALKYSMASEDPMFLSCARVIRKI